MAKHGGLSKAGKVRKATPKVEKEEKTWKNPTGRARQRKKFNKRFYFMKQTNQKKMNIKK